MRGPEMASRGNFGLAFFWKKNLKNDKQIFAAILMQVSKNFANNEGEGRRSMWS